jgi:hypothetical protein
LVQLLRDPGATVIEILTATIDPGRLQVPEHLELDDPTSHHLLTQHVEISTYQQIEFAITPRSHRSRPYVTPHTATSYPLDELPGEPSRRR